MANEKTTTQDWTKLYGQKLSCLRCGGTHFIVLPLAVTDFTKVLKAFAALHKYCKKKYE